MLTCRTLRPRGKCAALPHDLRASHRGLPPYTRASACPISCFSRLSRPAHQPIPYASPPASRSEVQGWNFPGMGPSWGRICCFDSFIFCSPTSLCRLLPAHRARARRTQTNTLNPGAVELRMPPRRSRGFTQEDNWSSDALFVAGYCAAAHGVYRLANRSQRAPRLPSEAMGTKCPHS